MFKNDFGEATIWQVASSFGPRSMLNLAPACIGVSLIAEKFAGSEKLVVPFWFAVSFFLPNSMTSYLSFVIICLVILLMFVFLHLVVQDI
jgi:hypothetical protein